ncbi:MAG: DNA recombination protein RmuC, partial [Petrimonas mucosa]
MEITGLLIGFVVGGTVAWIMATLSVRSKTVSRKELETVNERNASLLTELVVAQEKLRTVQENEADLRSEISTHLEKTTQLQNEIQNLERELTGTVARLDVAHQTIQ